MSALSDEAVLWVDRRGEFRMYVCDSEDHKDPGPVRWNSKALGTKCWYCCNEGMPLWQYVDKKVKASE